VILETSFLTRSGNVMDTPWNLVLVGSGWAHHAIAVAQEDPQIRLAAIVARGSERSLALAARCGVPLVHAVEEIPPEASPRVAVVAVDEQVTPAVARALLARGCHVLCAHPVARTASEVRELATAAAQHGRLIATDYTLPLAAGARVAREALAEEGPLLRVAVEHPGRLLPMALHLACFFAGPVLGVHASRVVPSSLQGQARASPGAFSPSLLLEHESGVISSLLGVPHAQTSEAFRCTLSGARGRLDVDLPGGEVRRVCLGSSGQSRTQVLHRGGADEDPFGGLMRSMTRAFLAAARSGASAPCPLSDEAEVRAIWNAIPVALRSRARATVDSSR